MTTTSTLPLTNPDTFFTWVKQVKALEPTHYKTHWYLGKHLDAANFENAQWLETLNQMIPQWKAEHSPDITHFKRVLDTHPRFQGMFAHVLFACMEKNNTNTEFLYNNIILNITKPKLDYENSINKEHYPELYNLLQASAMDYLMFHHGEHPLKCLNAFMDEQREFKILNKKDPLDIHILNHIFKDPRMYKDLLSYDNDDLLSSPGIIESLCFFNLRNKTNVGFSIDNINLIYPDLYGKLMFLTGMYIVTEHPRFADWKAEIEDLYSSKYPVEFKLMNTLRSLDIQNVSSIVSNIILAAPVYDTIAVELPTL